MIIREIHYLQLFSVKSQTEKAYKIDDSNNLLPIARRSNGDCQIGSSPGSGSLLTQTFPEFSSQWHILRLLTNTVAGPRRPSTGLPY
jgi:hypothetical protein